MLKNCWVRLVRLDNAQIYEAGLAIVKKELEDHGDSLSIETTQVVRDSVSRRPSIENMRMGLLWLEPMNRKDAPGVDPLFIKNENVGEAFAILKPGLGRFRDTTPLLGNIVSEQKAFSVGNPLVKKENVCSPQKSNYVRDQWWETITILKSRRKKKEGKKPGRGKIKECDVLYRCKLCSKSYKKDIMSRLLKHSQSHFCWVKLERSKQELKEVVAVEDLDISHCQNLSGCQREEIETNNFDNVGQQKSEGCKEVNDRFERVAYDIDSSMFQGLHSGLEIKENKIDNVTEQEAEENNDCAAKENVVSSLNLFPDFTTLNVDKTENIICLKEDITSEGIKSKFCTACDQTFLNEQDLFCHQKIHNAIDMKSLADQNNISCYQGVDNREYKYPCHICQKGFQGKGCLSKHFLFHTKPYACILCAQSFGNKILLEEHSKQQHSIALNDNVKKYNNCVTNPFHLKNGAKMEVDLELLIKRMPPLLLFQRCKCSQCDKTFYTKSLLTEHFQSTHSPTRIYQCDSCDVCFDERRKLIVHLETVNPNNVQPFLNKCLYCAEWFYNKPLRYKHMMKCRKSHELSCDSCGKKFYNKRSLKLHILQHKTVTIKMASVDSNKQLKDHKKAYDCVICHAKFTKRFDLVSHMNSLHLKLNGFVCVKCGKTLKSQLDLFHHRSHSQHKQNLSLCELCGKTFKQDCSFISHMQRKHLPGVVGTETDKRCLESSQYSKTFTRVLERQMDDSENAADWTGLRLQTVYICEICGKKLTNMDALRLHLRVHNLIMPHVCRICKKNFTRRDALARHKKNCHNHFTKCNACKTMF